MNVTGLAYLAAALLGGSAALGAQSPFNSYGRMAPLELVPYGELMQVPPNGCVWENLVYSNGAVIARWYPSTTYFQCERGTWTIISPGDAIFGRRAPERPVGAQPTPP